MKLRPASTPRLSLLTRGSLLLSVALLATGGSESSSLNHPTGSNGVIMIDKLGAHIRFFDPSLSEIASIETAPNPHDFILSADHKLAYIPIYGDGVYGKNPNPGHEVDVVDLTAHRIVRRIDITPHRAPHGIQIDAAGMLYVTCDLDRQVLVIDSQSGAVRATIDTEGTGHWIGILPDASKLYVANKDDRRFISVLDLKARKMVGKIPVPNGTQGIAVSPDGRRVVAMDMVDPTLIVIDPATDTVIDRIPVEGQKRVYKVYYSPDGRKLLTMSSSPDQINIFDAANLRGAQRVVNVGKSPMGFGFSPDGRTVLVANHGDGTVTVVDIEKAAAMRTFKAGTGIETLAWY
jgi:YVTN family beta-propeller protein